MLAIVAITRLKTVAEPRVEEKVHPTKNDCQVITGVAHL
jgi:hypothetical protein